MINVVGRKQYNDAFDAVVANGVDGVEIKMTAMYQAYRELFYRGAFRGKTAIFCGDSNNGLDGIFLSIFLKSNDCSVDLYFVGDAHKRFKGILPKLDYYGIKVHAVDEFVDKVDFIVDAIYGAELDENVDEETSKLIDMLNNAECLFRVALDVPTGLNADTGRIMGNVFNANFTVYYECVKFGMLHNNGLNCCGEFVGVNLNLHSRSDVVICQDEDFPPWHRKPSSHKGDFGKIYVIGGSANMIGAPMLSAAAARAAQYNGAGRVTLCLPEILRVSATSRVCLSMLKFLSDTQSGSIRFVKKEWKNITRNADTICFGMGLGKCKDTIKIIKYLCKNFKGKLIIDADGLNALGKNCALLRSAKCQLIITPHVGEFCRLIDCSPNVDGAKSLARKIGGVVVLKSAATIISDGDKVRINIAGTPALAKGGSGDLLCGAIAALSCSFPLIDAATIACYRNGMGAKHAVSSYAELMLSPHDVLKFAEYPEIYALFSKMKY